MGGSSQLKKGYQAQQDRKRASEWANRTIQSAHIWRNDSYPECTRPKFDFLKQILFTFNFLFHKSQHKFDRQIIVSNQTNRIWKNHEKNADVVLGPDKEFVVTYELKTYGVVQHTNVQSQVWYDSAIQAP